MSKTQAQDLNQTSIPIMPIDLANCLDKIGFAIDKLWNNEVIDNLSIKNELQKVYKILSKNVIFRTGK